MIFHKIEEIGFLLLNADLCIALHFMYFQTDACNATELVYFQGLVL